MDERYEHLCEIGQVLMDADRKELLKVYIDLMLEHYPVELLEVFGDRPDTDSDYEPSESSEEEVVASDSETKAEPEPEPAPAPATVEQVMAQEEVSLTIEGEESDDSYDSGESEDDSHMVSEELIVKQNGNFYELA